MPLISLYHEGRELSPHALDQDDGTFLIQYADTGDMAVVPAGEIEQRLNS
jgi:hypothetical protein